MQKSTMACWLVAGVVSVGGAFAMGCSQQAAPTTTERVATGELHEGLTILSAKPDFGVSAAFKVGDHVVYFETRVGPLKPENYRKDFPDEPQYEMDARFVDKNGHTFKLQAGGDTLIDNAWPADIAKGKLTKDSVSKADRELDYTIARDAAREFAKVAPAELKDHVFHILNMGNLVPREIPRLLEREKAILATPVTGSAPVAPGGGDTVGHNSSCYYNWLEGDVGSKCIALCAGHHSAVNAWNYSNCTSTWDEQTWSCNHGTCGNSLSYDSGAGNSVSGWVGGNKDLSQAWNYEWRSDLSIGNGCSSGYNWNTPPGHECNSDTAYELNQIKNAASYGSGSTPYGNNWSFSWADSNGHHYNCDGSGKNCSGDWSVPKAP